MSLTLSKTIPVAAIAFLGYAVIASSAQASVTSKINNCRYDTKQKVVDCCERALRNEDKPAWMVESGRSCSAAAVCVKVRARGGRPTVSYVSATPMKKRCFIKMQIELNDGGNNKNPNGDRGRPQRGNRSFN
jgi:hypothetical protein